MREWGHIFNCQYFLGEIRSRDHPAIKGTNQRKNPFSEIDRTLFFLEEDSLLTIEDVPPKHITVPIEQKILADKTVHSIGAGTLLVCLAAKISSAEVEPLALGIVAWHKQLAPAGETSVVLRDSAFADDVAQTNLTAFLQQHGLENIRSL